MKTFNKNKILKIFSLLLAFACVIASLPMSARALEDPDLLPEAAMLLELTSGTVLYAKNENARRAPASLTKIMTVMLAIEAIDRDEVSLTDIVTVGDDAYFDITPDGSTSNLQAGEEMPLEDMLYCAMIASANESCNILAEFIAGSTTAFLERMNKRAEELGCTNTHFANCHGMPNANHYSTAADLMLIAECALEKPLFRQIVSTPVYTVPATNLHKERELKNTNQLIRSGTPYYYPEASGVKTGYTDAAGFCLVSYANKNDLTLISVVLGAKSIVKEDGNTQTQSFSETVRLLDWGFDNFSYQNIITTTKPVKEITVELAKGAGSVVLCPSGNISALLPNDIDVEKADKRIRVYHEEKGEALFAPVSQGTVLGDLTIILNGVNYGTVPLVAHTAVELDRMAYVMFQVRQTLSNVWVKVAIVAFIIFLLGYIAYIILYTVNRRRRKAHADELARRRIEEARAQAESDPSRTFEDIEAIFNKKR